ncbi:uncharacterized protein LOC123565059 [Mercenaria mercenaria]|uniref:uncharacterized protein LOC123565059 n=1 Tax=Mercenaria mercenaria TaxID=6596 RepID=UPI00234EF437|nr:uncharacterized protein LOC123565059 [Mercenaria mercenaria]
MRKIRPSAFKSDKKLQPKTQKQDREKLKLTKENEKLKKELKRCKDNLKSVSKIDSLYRRKLCDDFDQKNINCYVAYTDKVQVGSNNLIQEYDGSKLNDLLLSYHTSLTDAFENLNKVKVDIETTTRHLENTKRTLQEKLKELQQTKYDLESTSEKLSSTKSELEGTATRLEERTRLLQELVEDLKDIKENDNNQTLKLKYTIGLTESPLMTNCINELKKLDKQDRKYHFADVPDKAKFGVMRILRKYCQKDPKLTNAEFAQILGIDAYDIEEDAILNEDNCTWILTKWVHTSPKNDNEALCEQLPKLKQYGSVYGTLGSMTYDGSVSRISLAGIEEQKAELLQEMRNISVSVQNAETTFKTEMQVLKRGQTQLGQDLKETISLEHQRSVGEIKSLVSSSTTKEPSDIKLPTP